MSTFRILSFDGGGIRGIYSAVLLNRIFQEIPELMDETKLFAGTGTGSMLALGLAYGIQPIELIELFRAYGQEVFADSIVSRVGQIVGAKYDILNFKKILTPYFGAAILYDFITRADRFVFVPAFDLDGYIDQVRTWKPKFFHNFPSPDTDAGDMAVDVILRSSATPVYFQSYQGYIDGGVVARNPSMAALAQALNPETGSQIIEDIRLFSLGSGYYPRYIGGPQQNWGLGRWSWPLISLLLDGQTGVNDYECRQILGRNRYHRLAPTLPAPVNLDDADKIPDLISYAEAVDIGPTVDWIKVHYLETSAPAPIEIKIDKSEIDQMPKP